ncbi:MAG: hypothetical protein IT438_06470, partial [Phycisphaerales bacterium]|nr:hypothetical protein [Phycisphaerales bacterium]
MNSRLWPVIAVASSLVSCAGVFAQPKLIITGIAEDLARTTEGVAGLVSVGLTGGNADYSTLPIVWRRGVGYSIVPGAEWAGDASVSCASDLTALSMMVENSSNWGDLNCFNGYCFGSLPGCTPGDPRPPLSPCIVPGVSHHWSASGGWINAGSFERLQDGATGRFYGGTRCDQTINTPNDLSGDGRYIVGGAYWAPLTTSSGGPAFGLCGHFYGFRYDSVTGQFTQLPSLSTTSRADNVNHDGSVISGYDLVEVPFDRDGDGIPDGVDSWRRTVVWRNGVEYVIDPHLGAKDNAAITGPGSMVASGASPQFVAENFSGQTGARLVRWSWDGSAWVPTNLGKPADYPDPSSGVGIPFSDLFVTGISDDGGTIVGMAQYGPPPPSHDGLRRPFIWRSTINGGVPIDLEIYLRSIDTPGNPIFNAAFAIMNVNGLSGDGNRILVSVFDQRNTCPIGFNAPRSHVAFNAGVVYIDGSALPCDPPRIGLGPENWDDTGGLSVYGVSLNVVASGTWPLNYRWQREDPANPGTWIDLPESCEDFSDLVEWDYEGVYKNQLRIGIGTTYASREGRYRVVISNSCGSVASEPALVTFSPGACCFAGGTCQIDFFYSCVGQGSGGVWQGADTTCEQGPCDARACCVDQFCNFLDPITCGQVDGTLGAAGSTCDPDPCSLQTGACCCGSSCTVTTAAQCSGANSAFGGAGTACTPFSLTSPCC